MLHPDNHPSGTLYKVRRITTIGEDRFEAGDPISRDKIPVDKFQRWFEQRVIVHASPEDIAAWKAKAEAETAKPKKAKAKAAGIPENARAHEVDGKTVYVVPKAEGDAAGASGEGGFAGGDPIVGTPESYIQHKGRGWHTVFHHGAIETVRGQEAAQAMLDQMRAAHVEGQDSGTMPASGANGGEAVRGSQGEGAAAGALVNGGGGSIAAGPSGEGQGQAGGGFAEQFAETALS